MLKWLAVGVGAVLLVIAAAVASLPWLIDTRVVQDRVAHAVASALGRPVTFASLSIAARPLPTVTLRGLTVAEDPAFGPGPFVTVGEGRLRLRLRPLLSGRIELADLTLESPRIAILEDRAGRVNVASLGAPAMAPAGSGRTGGARRASGGAAASVLVSSIRIIDGSVEYQRLGGGRPAFSLQKIDLTVRQAAAGEALQLGGGAIAEPGGVRLTVTDATLTPTSSRVLGDMALRAAVRLEAADVAAIGSLLFGSPALSGPLAGQLELAGTPARLSATGAISLDRLTLARARPACGDARRRQLLIDSLRLPIAVNATRLESAPAEARLGRGAASLRAGLTFSAGVLALDDIAVKGVELGPILADYLCQPYAVTGPLDLTGTASLRLGVGLDGLDGAGRLRIGAGKVVGRDIVNLVRDVVGIGTAISAATGSARTPGASPLDFDAITATYAITGGVARTEDLLYRAREVRVTGDGTYRLADGRVAMELALTEGTNQVKGVVAGAPGSLRIVPTGVSVRDRDVRKFLDRLFR